MPSWAPPACESDQHVSWLIVMSITISFDGDIDDNNLDDDYNDDDGDGDDDDKYDKYDICEPGLVFLVYRGETKRALLPNEVSFIDTVKALFVRLDWWTLNLHGVVVLNVV